MIISFSDRRLVEQLSVEPYRGFMLTSYCASSSWICEANKRHQRMVRSEADSLSVAIQMTKHALDKKLGDSAVLYGAKGPPQKALSAALLELTKTGEPFFRVIIHQLIQSDSASIEVDRIKQALGCPSITEVYLYLAEFGRAICDELSYAPRSRLEGRDAYLDFVLQPENHYYNTGNNSKLVFDDKFYRALCDTHRPA